MWGRGERGWWKSVLVPWVLPAVVLGSDASGGFGAHPPLNADFEFHTQRHPSNQSPFSPTTSTNTSLVTVPFHPH